MNDTANSSVLRQSQTAKFVDKNFEKAATTIDQLRSSLLMQNDTAEKPVPFVGNIAAYLASSSDRLRATSGADVVEYGKGQMDRYSTLISVAAAAIGVVAVQLAVATVRKDRRQAARQVKSRI